MENQFELSELDVEKIILNQTPTHYKVSQVFVSSSYAYLLVLPEVKIDELFAVAAIGAWHTFEILIDSELELVNYEFYLIDRNRRTWILHSALDILRNEEDLFKWRYGISSFQVKLPLPNLIVTIAQGLRVDPLLLTTS